MPNVMSLPSVGPYVGVSADVKRGRYRLLLSGAYNACGLIGSEYNGIVVLDDQELQVVADRLFCADSGYFGPSDAQRIAFRRLLTCSPEQFADIINGSGRNRLTIRPEDVPPPLTKEQAQGALP